MLKSILKITFVIGLFASLAACKSSSEADPIVGKWFGPASYFEIMPDGPDGFIITAHTAAPGFGWGKGEWTAVPKNDRYLVDGSRYAKTFRLNSETDILTTEYYGKLLRLRPEWDFNEARNLIGERARQLREDTAAWQEFLDQHAEQVAD